MIEQARSKPVLINFWASWCPHYKSEMPAIQKVWEHYPAEGIMVLAINATHQDSSSTAARIFLQTIRGDSSLLIGNIRTVQGIAWLFPGIALRFINLRVQKDEGSK